MFDPKEGDMTNYFSMFERLDAWLVKQETVNSSIIPRETCLDRFVILLRLV